MYEINDLFTPNIQDLDYNMATDVFLGFAENDLIQTADPNSEETLDVANMVNDLKYNPQFQFIPNILRGPPERKTMTEKCDFSIDIDGSLTHKKKFVYSHLLNRIYVEMNCNFSVNFNWNVNKVPQQPMCIRATVVFADPEQAEKRVERCLQHAHVTSNAETTDKVVVNNVLRSAREMGDPNVQYGGVPEEPDVWYSVLVKLSGPTGHAYKFVCKNSCSSGINRRAIEIIFTLEDYYGTVYGRQSVGARVCSCIRRDKNTQEQEYQARDGKRALPRPPQPPQPTQPLAKKIKLEVASGRDTEVLAVPKVEIVRTAISSLKVAQNMMDQLRATSRSQQRPADELDSDISSIKKIIEHLETKY